MTETIDSLLAKTNEKLKEMGGEKCDPVKLRSFLEKCKAWQDKYKVKPFHAP